MNEDKKTRQARQVIDRVLEIGDRGEAGPYVQQVPDGYNPFQAHQYWPIMVAVEELGEPSSIGAVRAIHTRSENTRWVGHPRADRQEHYCTEDQRPWPCPTIEAIDESKSIRELELETGFREVTLFQAVCQCCGYVVEDYGDYSCMGDPGHVKEWVIDSGWMEVDGKLLCESCWTWPDDDAESDDAIRAHDQHPVAEGTA